MEREIENQIELVPQVGWDAAYCEFVHEYSVIILREDNLFSNCSIHRFSRSALSSELTSICIWSLQHELQVQQYPDAGYPDRLGSSGKSVENSTKLTCLEISEYRIKYSTLLWLLELQIRYGRKVETQIHTVNSNSRASNCQCSQFSKKHPIIRIFCISEWLAVPVNPDKWSSAVCVISFKIHFKSWNTILWQQKSLACIVCLMTRFIDPLTGSILYRALLDALARLAELNWCNPDKITQRLLQKRTTRFDRK
jgi:hypothetical protein